MAVSRIDEAGLNVTQYGNRNLVINGMFNVAQRGTSQTASGYGSVDRWYLYSSGGTYSQETSGGPDGFSHYLKCAGATGSVIFAQAIELPATGNAGVFYNGQTITLSYYAKSTVAGDALYNPLSFRNSQTSITNLVTIDNDSSDTNVLTTSWARYSKTYTIGVNVDANNTCLVMQPRTSGAPSGDISITGVQLEVGDTATGFEHRSYGDELARCLRYFFRIEVDNSSSNVSSNGWWDTSTGARISYDFPVIMRAIPSLTLSSISDIEALDVGTAWNACSAGVITSETSRRIGHINFTSSGGTQGQATAIRVQNSGKIDFDAEL